MGTLMTVVIWMISGGAVLALGVAVATLPQFLRDWKQIQGRIREIRAASKVREGGNV